MGLLLGVLGNIYKQLAMGPFLHIDCNNFYVSCERAFNPSLENRPVIVLSNNDGCAISRSNEAKAIGIKMGEPAFKFRDKVEKYNIEVFSANFVLYGDMSNRVMSLLSKYSSNIEIYSIDEAFLELSDIDEDLRELGLRIKKDIEKSTHIPISVGIGPTKSLAKTATSIAKKYRKETLGVHYISNEELRVKALKWLDIGDVWGIGRRYAKKLRAVNINNALEFTQMSEYWVRESLSISGLKLMRDMKGIVSLELDTNNKRKSISITRTFDESVSDYEEVRERIFTFACKASEKLRKQGSKAGSIQVFIASNPHRKDQKQYRNSMIHKLPYPSNNSVEIAKQARICLDRIFREGYLYKRAGVVLMDFCSDKEDQLSLFDEGNPKYEKIIGITDKINNKYGRSLIKLAAQSQGRDWKMRQEKLSREYTTDINDIIEVRLDKS